MGGIEGQPGREARRLPSEKQVCPRRGNPTAVKTALSRRQTEREGKAFWDAEESNGHAARCWDSRIANQPLLKVETIMRSLCTGQGRRSEIRAGREPLLSLYLHTLGTQQLSAHPSMVPTTPISPEQGRGTDNKGMQEHTDLARLGGSAALPLTLFPQGTGATTADAGRIDHTQAPVGFSAPLMRDKWLVGRTAQRAIGLESKVSPGEAALFPGKGYFCWPVSLRGRRRERLFWRRQESRSKLGGAHRIRGKLMAQFQAQVPHPLADDLPYLLAASCMTTPAVGILFAVFIGERVFKRAAMQIQRHDIGRGERTLGQIRQEQFVDHA